MALHPVASGDEVHRPYRWNPADAATRVAINVGTPSSDDVGCFALQADDKSVWVAIATGTGASKWAFVGVDFQLTISPSQLTANQNDYNPSGFNTAAMVRLDVDSTVRNITGFVVPVTSMLQKVLVNISANTLVIQHQNTGSSAANRVICPNGVDFRLLPGTAVRLHYDATDTRWRLLPFSGGAHNAIVQTKSSSFSATAFIHYAITTLSAALTATMPASPAVGDQIWFSAAPNSNVYNVTIDGNGKNIVGSSTLVLNTPYASAILEYDGTEWRVF